MADMHIEEFYHDIAHALVLLYSAFPRQINVYVDDFAGADTPDEYGLHSSRYLSGFSALLWLKQQGHITFDSTVRQTGIEQATLTQASFIALLSEYSAASTPLIQALQRALKQQATTHVNALMLQFLQATNTK